MAKFKRSRVRTFRETANKDRRGDERRLGYGSVIRTDGADPMSQKVSDIVHEYRYKPRWDNFSSTKRTIREINKRHQVLPGPKRATRFSQSTKRLKFSDMAKSLSDNQVDMLDEYAKSYVAKRYNVLPDRVFLRKDKQYQYRSVSFTFIYSITIKGSGVGTKAGQKGSAMLRIALTKSFTKKWKAAFEVWEMGPNK